MMTSNSSTGSLDNQFMEEDILILTFDVRSLKKALERLRKLFPTSKETHKNVRVTAHECLGEILRALRTILMKYPQLQSSELLVAAGALIHQVKNHKYEENTTDTSEYLEAIDQLALTFSSRVSEYLMGDIDTTPEAVTKTKSCENLAKSDENITDRRDSLTTSETERCLKTYPQVVELALRRAKLWSKYSQNILTYIEKRSQLEADHARNLAKLSQMTRPLFQDQNQLPFQSIYCASIDHDLENSSNSLAICNALQGHKFTEPLTNRLNDHEKARKHIKAVWSDELKKMKTAVEKVEAAKEVYVAVKQEYNKIHDAVHKSDSESGLDSSKTDKKQRLEEVVLKKMSDAEATYKNFVMEANQVQISLQKVQSNTLKQIQELMNQCDQTMKSVTVSYFQLQHTVFAAAPIQFHTLYESSRQYEPGMQYMEFVKMAPTSSITKKFRDVTEQPRPLSCQTTLKHQNVQGKGKPSRLNLPGLSTHVSDSDSSCNSELSNKSPEISPPPSPPGNLPRFTSFSSGDELEGDFDVDREKMHLSKAAKTHVFRKLMSPSQCRECDTYVYFQGLECLQCGLHCHRKCLETLTLQCGHKKKCRKMTVFGVPLTVHFQHSGNAIPSIVNKCTSEIESKGFFVKGIYRISGVKSKVEKLCQRFEKEAELVDFADSHATVVATVLKLYLRQLPEPLLTYRLYTEFIRVAKAFPTQREEWSDQADAVNELKHLAQNLPQAHYQTLAYLMHHLKRLSLHAEHNHMPASNLGIVFGPTLLRTNDRNATLISLMDTIHQTRATELLIKHAYSIFHQSENGTFSSADYKDESCSENYGRCHDEDHSLPGQSEYSTNFYRESLYRARTDSSEQTDGSESSAKSKP